MNCIYHFFIYTKYSAMKPENEQFIQEIILNKNKNYIYDTHM